MYVPDNQKEGGGGGGHRALVENGGLNPAHKETEAWWSKKVSEMTSSIDRVFSLNQFHLSRNSQLS